MHRILVFVAYGWLTFGGTMHVLIDVVSHYVRRKRAPGPETTLYYGLNTAYALSQILFGLLGLLVARQAPGVLGQWPAVTLSLAATCSWLAFGVKFIEYREPKIIASLFGALVIAAAFTA